MTLLSDIAALAKVQVGSGGGASAEYPVLRCVQSVRLEGAPGISPQRLIRRTWTITALAGAASNAAVQALRGTLESTLVRSGERIRITERGGTRDMPASDGTDAGSMPGYPMVSLSEVGEFRVGPYVGFTLTCETVVFQAGDAVHQFSIEESTDSTSGETTETGRGTVIVAPGYVGGAKAWIEANVEDALQTRIGISDEMMVFRITRSQDPTRAEYSYTINPPDDVLAGSGVESARVVDETIESHTGDTVRRISGEATGSGAAAFAAAQEPTPGSGWILTRRQISDPQVTSGRVSFSYEMLKGVADAYFDAAVLGVLSFTESIEPVSEGLRLGGVHTFSNTQPVAFLGVPAGYRYVQRSRLRYVGTKPSPFSKLDGAIPFLMSSGNILGDDAVTRVNYPDQGAAGVRIEELSVVYFFATAQTVPSEHQIPAL